MKVIDSGLSVKISSDQGGVMEGPGQGEKILKIFKELSDAQVRGAVENHKVKFSLHRGNAMLKIIKPGGMDKSVLESIVH